MPRPTNHIATFLNSRTSGAPVRRACPLTVAWVLAAVLLPSLAVPAARAESETITSVTIERERPAREKLPTLRFLKANRDFIRARFDRLRQESRVERADAGTIDPRFLTYRQLLREIAMDKDSVTVASDARERAALFASVTDLGNLERELDQMERLLDAQRVRLGVLQADFAGRQRTELDVLLTGATLVGRVDSVLVTLEDGSLVATSLTETQRNALKHGGVLEVFRGLVEPRDQVLEVALRGEGWDGAGHGFLTFEPGRNRLTFLRLDLSQASPASGIGSMIAGTWVLDPSLATADPDRDRP